MRSIRSSTSKIKLCCGFVTTSQKGRSSSSIANVPREGDVTGALWGMHLCSHPRQRRQGLGRANNHSGFFWCSCVVLAQKTFDIAWTSLCRSNSGALTCSKCCVSGVALLAGRTKADAVSSGNSAGTQRPSEATPPF